MGVGETDIASTKAGGCDDPFEQRVRESSLDLGTAFDCFSDRSATGSPSVSAQARVNRDRPRRALEAEGFRNYAREWWHFDFHDRLAPNQAYDFPVR
jgi:D-alanyl-D-alanine dipeptidase